MDQLKNDLDVIIIGGGPAGLSAALWCSELGLMAELYEKEAEFGGQLLWTFNSIKNYLGVEVSNGRELQGKFLQHLAEHQVPLISRASVVKVDLKEKAVTMADGRRSSAKAIIIATGVRRRGLDVAGELEFQGKGILDSGVRAKNEVAGKSVVIVGGGDAALENALILSETARKVTIVHRRKNFSARPEFVELAKQVDAIEFITDGKVRSIIGKDTVEAVELSNATDDSQLTAVPADTVLIRIGVLPNTEMFRGQIDLDERGYIVTDTSGAASEAGVFAIGDAANPLSPTISTAAGDGAAAAKAISRLISTPNTV